MEVLVFLSVCLVTIEDRPSFLSRCSRRTSLSTTHLRMSTALTLLRTVSPLDPSTAYPIPSLSFILTSKTRACGFRSRILGITVAVRRSLVGVWCCRPDSAGVWKGHSPSVGWIPRYLNSYTRSLPYPVLCCTAPLSPIPVSYFSGQRQRGIVRCWDVAATPELRHRWLLSMAYGK